VLHTWSKRFVMGGDFEVRYTDDVQTQAIKYYSEGGEKIAMRSCSGKTCGDPTYLLTDHLGSIAATTDASGNLLNQQRYKPAPSALQAPPPDALSGLSLAGGELTANLGERSGMDSVRCARICRGRLSAGDPYAVRRSQKSDAK
jgi:hypothetical protein